LEHLLKRHADFLWYDFHTTKDALSSGKVEDVKRVLQHLEFMEKRWYQSWAETYWNEITGFHKRETEERRKRREERRARKEGEANG
jgi:hypothetical protein